MDGLLVDSERLERRVWQAAASDHGVEMSDERFASFVGHPAEECDRLLGHYYGDAFDVSGFRAACHHRPDLYLEAAARLGVAPEASLAVEDSPTGAQAALAAHMPVVVVPDLVPLPPNVASLTAGVFDSLHAVRRAAGQAWGNGGRRRA